MRTTIKITFTLFLILPIAVVSVRPALAQGANQPHQEFQKLSPAELFLGYSYMRSNAPPGGCGCFNLNGGSGAFAWTLKQTPFALVGDVTFDHSGSVSTSGESLTLSTFTGGGRYQPRLAHFSLQPFGQVLVGLAHSSGSLVQGSNPGAANAGVAFAANVGGGLDLRTNRALSIRLVETDYLVTTFKNGSNDHQNILRIGAGLVLRFGRR